jgi:hypothetical protein
MGIKKDNFIFVYYMKFMSFSDLDIIHSILGVHLELHKPTKYQG